jgi:hypothetical protein
VNLAAAPLIVLLSAGVPGPTPAKVELDNAVGPCLRVSLGESFWHQNLLLVQASVSLLRSTATCGCKSAVLSTRATDGPTNSPRQLVAAQFSSLQFQRDPRPFLFVLAASLDVAVRAPLVLHLGCAPPD